MKIGLEMVFWMSICCFLDGLMGPFKQGTVEVDIKLTSGTLMRLVVVTGTCAL